MPSISLVVPAHDRKAVHHVRGVLLRETVKVKKSRIDFATEIEAAIRIPLERRAFETYDPGKKGWVTEPGDYNILLGSSSRDIRCAGKFVLK